MNRIPRPRALRSPSRLSTSIRVDASSMLMISSATRSRMSSSSARAISRRWSWPPLSWCGYLWSTWPGSRPTASSDVLDAGRPTPRPACREVDAADHAEDVVGLEDRVVRAERVLEDALDQPVVPLARQLRHVLAVERDRAAGDRGQPQDHPPDRRLAAAALADQRDDLAGVHVEAHVLHRRQVRAAEGAHLVDLGDAVERQHRVTTPSSRRRSGRGPISTNGGSSRHCSSASGQRAWKRHPSGGSRSAGGLPGMPDQPLVRVPDADLGERGDQQARVGMPGRVDDDVGRGLLGQLARVHHGDRVGDLGQDRHVVGDHDHAPDELAVAELDERLGHGLLGRDVERRGDLVGDQQGRVEQAWR